MDTNASTIELDSFEFDPSVVDGYSNVLGLSYEELEILDASGDRSFSEENKLSDDKSHSSNEQTTSEYSYTSSMPAKSTQKNVHDEKCSTPPKERLHHDPIVPAASKKRKEDSNRMEVEHAAKKPSVGSTERAPELPNVDGAKAVSGVVVKDQDYINASGHRAMKHPGNILFRAAYVILLRRGLAEKEIKEALIRFVHNRGGRFVREVEGTWQVTEENCVRLKIQAFFRDSARKKTPEELKGWLDEAREL